MNIKKTISMALATILTATSLVTSMTTTAFARDFSASTAPVTNATYRFANVSSGLDLNSYEGAGAVNVYTEDGSKDQLWYWGTDSKLYNEQTRNTKSLTGTNGSVTMTVSGTTIQLQVVTNTTYGPQVRIKNSSGYYLQGGATSEAACKWSATPDNSSLWYCERIIRISNFTGNSYGAEFFSARVQANMPLSSTYDFTDSPFSTTWQTGVDKLYKKCFGTTGTATQKYGNLYGALYNENAGSYKGKFHTGIDMNYYNGAPISSPVSGNVVATITSLGGVVIQPTGKNYYIIMLHMSGIKGVGPVTVGDTIGKQSNVGVTDSHLHVEISNSTSAASIPMNSFAKLGNTVYPYDILNAIL